MNNPKKIGILGGGQLALMLAESTQNFLPKNNLFAISQNSHDPISSYCLKENHFIGSASHKADLTKLFSQVDTIVFENEFVDCNLLKEFNNNFVPNLNAISILQNKINQKKLLEKLKH